MEPIVPVYLNQKFIFDLVAMQQGGIATVTKVSSDQYGEKNIAGTLSSSFGLSEAFSSLLKINLSTNLSGGNASSSTETKSEERVHTPGSLFYQLRNELLGRGTLKKLTDGVPASGDFVEFQASLKRSPLVEGLDAVTQLLEMSVLFTSKDTQKKQRTSPHPLKELSLQLKSLSDSLKAGGSRDLIADKIITDWKAVLSVEEQFLNDLTMSDIVDGTFHIVGKVVRVVEAPHDSINLLRKTPLAHTPEILEELLRAFKNMDEGIFSMREMETEINGPAIQVLPIAIYA